MFSIVCMYLVQFSSVVILTSTYKVKVHKPYSQKCKFFKLLAEFVPYNINRSVTGSV